MTTLRLIADDLTGALDTGAEFVPLLGAVPCLWDEGAPLPATAVLDSGTRELDRAAAAARFARLAPALDGADIAFLKIDSLLRGHGMAELAACLRSGAWHSAILAPAFPFQGRVTRAGRQFARTAEGAWAPVGAPLRDALQAEGIAVRIGRPGDAAVPGVTVFDAESEADLLRIAETGRSWPGPLLWCGSGGLARALAHADPERLAPPRGPILGLFGSDQPATAAQLRACGAWHLPLPLDGSDGPRRVGHLMADAGCALVSFDLPVGMARAPAAAAIRAAMAKLVPALPAPRTVLVAGGETLRALCDLLGARRLDVTGAMMPGVPRSVLRGGAWDGTEVISKSGAFGPPGLLSGLLRDLLTGVAFGDALPAVERTGS